MDVEGSTGLVVRGVFSTEGKVLFMIDGVEMNETMYGTTILGGRFPLDNIQQIEIIRGPGSAIYGGFAELCVINIVTQTGKEINGLYASGNYSQIFNEHPNAYGTRNINAGWGKSYENGLNIAIGGSAQQMQRSNYPYIDYKGQKYMMKDSATIGNIHLNTKIQYKNFNVKLIWDNVTLNQRDNYGISLPRIRPIKFNNVNLQASYDYKINDKLTITPKVTARYLKPWEEKSTQQDSLEGLYKAYIKQTYRIYENIIASYKHNENISFIAGLESFQEQGDATGSMRSQYFISGSDTVATQSFYNVAAFAESNIKTKFANFTIGARYDRHSAFPQTFNPRFAVVKNTDKFSIKLLAASSYRAPVFENIRLVKRLHKDIKPEKTITTEFEIKYNVSKKMYVAANAFYLDIRDPIVFTIQDNEELYKNAQRMGSTGFELSGVYRDKWGYINLTYSYFMPNATNDTLVRSIYGVPGTNRLNLGIANHRGSIDASIKITEKLSVNPAVVFIGERKGYANRNQMPESELVTFDPLALANLYVHYDTPLKGLSVGVGAYNILGANYEYIQPYNGGHTPLPAEPRQVMLRVKYLLSSDK
jgi:outer membrane cobalamin receptor